MSLGFWGCEVRYKQQATVRALICLLTGREWKPVRDLGYWVVKLPCKAHRLSHDCDVHPFSNSVCWYLRCRLWNGMYTSLPFPELMAFIPRLVHLKGESLWVVSEGEWGAQRTQRAAVDSVSSRG